MQDFNYETLLVFAHRAEASAFLAGATALAHPFEGLHSHPELGLILICGEGLWTPRERLASVLTRFREIGEVINLGVCAGVRPGLETESIYSVRTVYAQGEFKSFTSSDESASIDCISAKERVLSKDKADALDNFAPLVERELWSIASVCEVFKTPWRAFKLISDLPAQQSSQLCEIVKEQAITWSHSLKSYYEGTTRTVNEASESSELFSEDNLGLFYLTTTLERQLLGLKAKLGAEVFHSHIKKLESQEFDRPKERTLALIKNLSRALNPFREKLEDEIFEKTKSLRESGIQVSYPWPLESTHLNLKFQLQTEADLERLQQALSKFSLTELKAVIEAGQFDV